MKICLIGNRAHSNQIVPQGLKADPALQLCAWCAADDPPEMMLANLTGWGCAAPRFDDYRVMLDEVKPDIVVIDSAFDRHAEMCMEALNRNIHVLSEKPLALSCGSFEQLSKASQNSKAHIAAMTTMRFEAPFSLAGELVRAGAIGEIRMIRAQKSYHLGHRAAFYHKRESYGGTIPWIGFHAFELMQFYGGGRRFVSAYATQDSRDNAGNGTMESSAQAILTMEDNIQCMASIDYLRPASTENFQDDRIRIAGSRGILEVCGGNVHLLDDSGEHTIKPGTQKKFLLAEFARLIRGEETDIAPDAEALELTETALLVQESADSGFPRTMRRMGHMGHDADGGLTTRNPGAAITEISARPQISANDGANKADGPRRGWRADNPRFR